VNKAELCQKRGPGILKALEEMCKEDLMTSILEHFIKSAWMDGGYGFFEGIGQSVGHARAVSKVQLRKLKRYGFVPSAFIDFLKERNICVFPCGDNKTLTELELGLRLLGGKVAYWNEYAEALGHDIAARIMKETGCSPKKLPGPRGGGPKHGLIKKKREVQVAV
jgi:hypothetical protein